MKYIRTKDGVFEWDKLLGVSQDYFENNPNEIIKESDFIDELCDFVFAEDKTHNHYLFELKYRGVAFKQRLREWKMDGWFIDVKYCIKSSTCLEFVAKMNDKGESELL